MSSQRSPGCCVESKFPPAAVGPCGSPLTLLLGVFLVWPLAAAGELGVDPQHIAAYGDSITASKFLGGPECSEPDWPCGLFHHTATDFGVAGESVAGGTARLNAALDADQVSADFVSLAWGTNDLLNAVYPAALPNCADVEVCFISQLRSSGERALDRGIVPILLVPIPWRIAQPLWDDQGGCSDDVCVTAGGTRAYIQNVLRPALIALAGELGDYDPPGPWEPHGRAVPLVDAFAEFVAFGPDMPLLYSWGHGIATDNGIHPTWLIHPPGPDGRTGAQVIADGVEATVTNWLKIGRAHV